MTISFGGISSGLDTQSIIDQLVALQKQPITKLQNRQLVVQAKRNLYSDASSKLLAVRTAADALKDIGTFQPVQNVQSTDEKVLTAAKTATTAAGGHTVNVSSLARAWQLVSGATTPVAEKQSSDPLFAAASADDTLSIQVGSGASIDVAITGGDDVNAIASKINAASGIGVSAAVSSGQLVLTSNTPGTTGQISISGAGSIATELGFTVTQAAQNSSTLTAASADDTLSIQVGSGAAVNVDIKAGDTIDTIASKINATSNTGVYASVMQGQLYLSAAKTGAANTISVSSAGSLAGDLGFSTKQAGADAAFTIDGTAYTRASNTVDDALAGVKLTFKQTGTASVNISEAAVDTGAVADRMKAFVDAYNAAMNFLYDKTNEKPIKDPQSDAARGVGAGFSDSTLNSIAGQLRQLAGRILGGAPSTANDLGDVGVTRAAASASSGNDARRGLLSFDSQKFVDAYNADPASVKALLNNTTGSSATEGFAQAARRALDPLMRGDLTVAKSTGLLQTAIDSQDSQIKLLTDQQGRLNDRVNAYAARLKDQFTRMETALAQYQAMGNAMNSAASSLRAA